MQGKKIIVCMCVMASLLVFSFGSVSASSTEPKRYVPMVPEFITAGSKPTINIPYDVTDSEAKDFFSDFYHSPYLVVVDQWTGANAQTNIDRKWELVFLKPVFKNSLSSFEFYYYDPLKNTNTATRPMGVHFTDNTSWEVLRYPYNFTTKKFDSPIVQTFNGEYKFSYVVDSARLTNPIPTYPHYSKIGGRNFEVYSYQLGSPAHYDWWLGNPSGGGTDNEDDNPTSSDTSSDGSSSGGSSSDTSSDGSSSGGSSSDTSSDGGTSSGGGGNPTYPKPGTGGDGDVDEDNPDYGEQCTITVNFYYIDENGQKLPFYFSDFGYSHINYVPYNGVYSFTPMSQDGYFPEHSVYKWLLTADRTVEIIFRKNNGGTSSDTSSDGTSSGGGSGSGGGNPNYPKPGTGGDGDIEGPPPDEINPPLFNMIIHFYYIDEKGYKKPFSYGLFGFKHLVSQVCFYTFYPKKYGDYYPEYSVYNWHLTENREVEVIFYSKNSGGSGGGGGGSGGSGDGDGGGGSGGGSGDGAGDHLLPIIPFDPDDWERFEPVNDDPWGGFDLFEGIGEPKPLPPSDELGDIPVTDNPLGSLDVPSVDNPLGGLDVPSVDNPLGGLDVPSVDNPLGSLDVPSVDNPLGGLDVPSADNPLGGLDVPSVDNPFGSLDVPVVDDPFGSLDVPVVDDPFVWKRE